MVGMHSKVMLIKPIYTCTVFFVSENKVLSELELVTYR